MKVLNVLLSSLSMVVAFTTPIRRAATTSTHALQKASLVPIKIQHSKPIGMSSGNSDGSKKRRKRKDGKQFAPPSVSEVTTVAADVEEKGPAPKQNTVVMQVRDVRSVVSGDESSSNEIGDEILGEDEEWEYYDDEEEVQQSVVSANTSRLQDDSMEQLLADARKMRASTTKVVEEKEKTMGDTFFEAISTIVTIDFFVVLGLLVWFLAGIFCSTVLKDDTVQIAFNMNFERVTQPALGILMIGSVAGGEYTELFSSSTFDLSREF